MNITSKLASMLFALGALSGCASRASGVAPLSVDASEYYALSCQEARSELAAAFEKEQALARKQNIAATADTIGVFFLLVPAGSVFGADVEGELALAKGQKRALESAVRTKCKAEAEAASN